MRLLNRGIGSRSIFAALLLISTHTTAKIWQVTDDSTLLLALTHASNNDTLKLAGGRYHGPLEINRALNIQCSSSTIIDGQKKENTLRIKSDSVTISGCRIENWSNNLTKMYAGIFVEKTANDVVIEHNSFYGDTFAIWLDGCRNSSVHYNKIQGNAAIRSQDRGNGIHLFATEGADIAFNEVWDTRDGIYIDTSNNNRLRNNTLHHLRYGIHYMYSYNNEVSGNYTHHTRTGYALMQSKHLTVFNNRSEYDENYGILMNYITDSALYNNVIYRVRPGGNPGADKNIAGAEGKALFVYNSVFNEMHHNRIQESAIGIHLTAGSEDNSIYGNNFISNQQQVKYVSTRNQEWSKDGFGNFWSDYLGWDRDNNGVGDTSYEPNDGVDKLLWKYPIARLLINSPAIESLRWIQREFPVLKTIGINDSYPLMKPSQYTETINGEAG